MIPPHPQGLPRTGSGDFGFTRKRVKPSARAAGLPARFAAAWISTLREARRFHRPADEVIGHGGWRSQRRRGGVGGAAPHAFPVQEDNG